jgi:transcriptional regulator with XRE-family HTH domain
MSKPAPRTKEDAHKVDIFVGRQICYARRARNMSMEALAASLGLTFQQVQKYEHGRNRVSAGRLFQIAGVLQKPVEWFFPDQQQTLDEGLAMPHGLEAVRAFTHLPSNSDRALAAGLLQRLAPAEQKANGHG